MRPCISLFIFLIAITLQFNRAVAGSSLNTEALVGGKAAPRKTFKYQAAIKSRTRREPVFVLLCGAGVLGNYYVASAASCFLDGDGNLRDESFAVVVGTTDLNEPGARMIIISRVLLPGFEETFTKYNLAIAELPESLELETNRAIQPLRLPVRQYQEFGSTPASVAGYGWESVVTVEDPESRDGRGGSVRFSGNSREKLRFGFVWIAEDDDCLREGYSRMDMYQMCGIMQVENERQRWGICEGDTGSPLVFLENMLVGIANRNRADCDDTKKGAKYSKVSYHLNFINGILYGPWPNQIIELNNNHF